MPAIRQNRLIQVLGLVALGVIGYIFWHISRDGAAPVSQGSPLEAVPSHAAPPPQSDSGSGMLSSARNATTAASADADTPTETLRTLTAEVASMRRDMQRVTDENRSLHGQISQLQISKEQLKTEVKSELQSEVQSLAAQAARPAPAAPEMPAGLGGKSGDGIMTNASNLAGGLVAQLPAGFGFETAGVSPTARPAAGAARTRQTILPVGVTMSQGTDGTPTLKRVAYASPSIQNRAANAAPSAVGGPVDAERGTSGTQPAKAKDKPYFTIPENATLMGATTMTAIVGRIPVDGRVQDPMQFKLLLGPENLAANGHFLPRDLSGIVVSGIAVGDMTMSCSEGLIQSLTFVFHDGAIRTVSMRNNGGTSVSLGGSGQGQQQSGLAQAAKLGYISDVYGNPCVAGQFITNAPEFLTSVIGLKTLSVAGRAAAAAQTTTSSSTGFGGVSTSSSVTGDKGTYILGESVSGATDEITNWVTRRMSNSFDAVVTKAGTRVVVHIDQAIAIDKLGDARFLDYVQDDLETKAQQQGKYHGLH